MIETEAKRQGLKYFHKKILEMPDKDRESYSEYRVD